VSCDDDEDVDNDREEEEEGSADTFASSWLELTGTNTVVDETSMNVARAAIFAFE